MRLLRDVTVVASSVASVVRVVAEVDLIAEGAVVLVIVDMTTVLLDIDLIAKSLVALVEEAIWALVLVDTEPVVDIIGMRIVLFTVLLFTVIIVVLPNDKTDVVEVDLVLAFVVILVVGFIVILVVGFIVILVAGFIVILVVGFIVILVVVVTNDIVVGASVCHVEYAAVAASIVWVPILMICLLDVVLVNATRSDLVENEIVAAAEVEISGICIIVLLAAAAIMGPGAVEEDNVVVVDSELAVSTFTEVLETASVINSELVLPTVLAVVENEKVVNPELESVDEAKVLNPELVVPIVVFNEIDESNVASAELGG